MLNKSKRGYEGLGMDMTLAMLDDQQKKLTVSGANNTLYLVRNRKIKEIKGDRQPVGFYPVAKPFSQETVDLEPGDTIYLTSDGYEDQFGGPFNKKLQRNKLRDIIL